MEPPPSRWALTLEGADPEDDLVALGGDLEPGTILDAYRRGLFPMGTGPAGRPPIGWWSPVDRGILLPGDLHVSRSLRKSRRAFDVTVDAAFDDVVRACADPARAGRWITPEVHAAYARLHELGWAHSIEVWRDGALAGGLYGLAVGGLFAGESMFHRVTDASKVAVAELAERFLAGPAGARLVDVQWQTPHLASLGVREVPRETYRDLLARALQEPWRPLDQA